MMGEIDIQMGTDLVLKIEPLIMVDKDGKVLTTEAKEQIVKMQTEISELKAKLAEYEQKMTDVRKFVVNIDDDDYTDCGCYGYMRKEIEKIIGR